MASFDPLDLAGVRERACAAKHALGPGPRLPIVAEGLVPGGRPVRLRLLSASSHPRGLLVYLHGGGWVMYSIDEYDRLARHLADVSGWAVVMVDYPLAPEQRYPAALERCWAALRFLGSREAIAWFDTSGITAPPRIVVAGDSAGAPPLVGQLLVYPVLDHDLNRPSYFRATHPEDISREELRVCWDLYCPDPRRRLETGASPLRAATLAGLPPTRLITADGDVLNDEIAEYGRRLRATGIAVSTAHVHGLGHGCLSAWKESPEVESVVTDTVAWLEQLARTAADRPR